MSEIPMLRCPVCGGGLKVSTSTSKRGKVALVLVCPASGRDFRAFINNPGFVRQTLEALEAKAAVTPSEHEEATPGSAAG